MSITESSEFSDVLQNSYVATQKTANNVASIARVGAANLDGRESIIIMNQGATEIYVGPIGVTSTTGIRVSRWQVLTLAIGQNIDVYVVTASGTSTYVVQELA